MDAVSETQRRGSDRSKWNVLFHTYNFKQNKRFGNNFKIFEIGFGILQYLYSFF